MKPHDLLRTGLAALAVLLHGAAGSAYGHASCYNIDGTLVPDDVPCRPGNTQGQPHCCRPGQDCMLSGLCRNPQGVGRYRFERPTKVKRDWDDTDTVDWCGEDDGFPVPVIVCDSKAKDGSLMFYCVDSGRDTPVFGACDGNDTLQFADSDGVVFDEDEVVDEGTATLALAETSTRSVASSETTSSQADYFTATGSSRSQDSTTRDTASEAATSTRSESSFAADSKNGNKDGSGQDGDGSGQDDHGGGPDTAVIVGAALGSFAGLCLVVAAAATFCWQKRRKRARRQSSDDADSGKSGPIMISTDFSGKPELEGDTYQQQNVASQSLLSGPQSGKGEESVVTVSPQSPGAAARFSVLSALSATPAPASAAGQVCSPLLGVPQEMPTSFNEPANFRIERKAVAGDHGGS